MKGNSMQVAIIGTGHVGLVTGAGLADLGHRVICADIDKEKVKWLQEGISPIYEPGLSELVGRNITKERLAFTTSVVEAVQASEVILA